MDEKQSSLRSCGKNLHFLSTPHDRRSWWHSKWLCWVQGSFLWYTKWLQLLYHSLQNCKKMLLRCYNQLANKQVMKTQITKIVLNWKRVFFSILGRHSYCAASASFVTVLQLLSRLLLKKITHRVFKCITSTHNMQLKFNF